MSFLVLFACAHPAPSTPAPAPAPPQPAELWISGYFSDVVARVDPTTGDVLDRLDAPGAQAILPWEGGALVVAEETGEILAFSADGTSRVWASGLASPTGITLLPDGNLAVGSFAEDRVLAFDPLGTLIGPLATDLDGVDAGLAVDAEGRLWVPCYDGNEVVVLDAGAVVLRVPVTRPRMIRHDETGVAWVTSWTPGAIRRFDASGADLGVFATRDGATGLALDGDGVWLASDQTGGVERLDRETGEVEATLTPNLDGITFVQPITPGG